jgi:hypothetical protein
MTARRAQGVVGARSVRGPATLVAVGGAAWGAATTAQAAWTAAVAAVGAVGA